jgi:hypothetical protein
LSAVGLSASIFEVDPQLDKVKAKNVAAKPKKSDFIPWEFARKNTVK